MVQLQVSRGRRENPFDAWIYDVIDTNLAPIMRFSRTPRRDIDAVEMPWSNSQVANQINRLKTLKRAMYGRADPNFLKAGMLPLYHTN